MLDTTLVALVAAILVNFAGVVWGAATVAASVRELRRTVDALGAVVGVVEGRVDSHDRRISFLEWIEGFGPQRRPPGVHPKL